MATVYFYRQNTDCLLYRKHTSNSGDISINLEVHYLTLKAYLVKR